MKNLIMILFVVSLHSCKSQTKEADSFETKKPQVIKTDEEWKKELTPSQYKVLREKGTERAFTGEYWNHFEEGSYVCAGCNNKLFSSDTKFESDCGWPSFDQAIDGSVIYNDDSSFGMSRIEVICAKCGGHLGHVFDDGPQKTTGKRFCTNSISIKFVPREIKTEKENK